MPEFAMVEFKSRARGRITDGMIFHDVAAYEHDVAKALGEEGEKIVLRKLRKVLRHPTGYYESKIAHREISENRYEVHDGGVVYGHWLEGTGSRNYPATIFPGYHTFEEAELELKKKRSSVARRILKEYRGRGLLT
jgi:hypothetical protein